ncbi:MAG: hypothetical protein ACLP1X_07590 [Polyangiaceae bacterium]
MVTRRGLSTTCPTVIAAVGTFAAASLCACALLVGDPQGELPADAGPASDARVSSDALGTSDGATSADGDLASDSGIEATGSVGLESGAYACAKGGCNAAGGICSGAGACHCVQDSQCPSGKCVKVTGQNDLSCQAACTGSGPADGFGCLLAANAIPASCTFDTFGFSPSNFVATAYEAPPDATTDCTATYSSTTHTFTSGSCSGQAPTIKQSVSQTGGGHAADLLIFKSLTLTGTLTLVGGNPVILAVYGNATITGTINASATGTTPGPGGNACATLSNGTETATGTWEPGAGGGGQSAAGGGGGSSTNPGGAGGVAQSSGTAPLAGGCAGGLPYVGSLGYSPVAGAGGGAVQISAAGVLDVTGGKIAANGSNGSGGEVGRCASSSIAQNGTGGAGGGSGGTILLEGVSVVAGTYQASGGSGGPGGAAPSPNSQLGGAGGAGGSAGNVGVAGGMGIQNGSAPPVCTWGGYWSGGGGGGGSGGFVVTNAKTGAGGVCATTLTPAPVCGEGNVCLCVADSDCSSGLCSNSSNQCSGTCSGSMTAGGYDSADCQILGAAPAP